MSTCLRKSVWWIDLAEIKWSKLGCIFLMVVVSILLHAEFGWNDRKMPEDSGRWPEDSGRRTPLYKLQICLSVTLIIWILDGWTICYQMIASITYCLHNFWHNDVKISAFPEGQYFDPNYFHNSNEKSGKPSIFTSLWIFTTLWRHYAQIHIMKIILTDIRGIFSP